MNQNHATEGNSIAACSSPAAKQPATCAVYLITTTTKIIIIYIFLYCHGRNFTGGITLPYLRSRAHNLTLTSKLSFMITVILLPACFLKGPIDLF